MVLDLIVKLTDDGVTAEIPSIHGCECWAHGEDEAIKKCVDLLRFYNNLPDDTEVKIDKARRTKFRIVYKLIFHKDQP